MVSCDVATLGTRRVVPEVGSVVVRCVGVVGCVTPVRVRRTAKAAVVIEAGRPRGVFWRLTSR